MKKKFGSLRLGEKFYPPRDDGTMDIHLCLIKVSKIYMTKPGPWFGVGSTHNAILHQHLNAVIISSPKDEITGYYDYLTDDVMVYPENLMC